MKRIIYMPLLMLGLALLFFGEPLYVVAQNYIVPTAPVGTNNNQAASTAFVQNAITTGGGPTESANTFFAGPSSGSPASATWRQIVGADLPSPTVSTLGGVFSLASVTHQWINGIGLAGTPTISQPNFTDIAGNLPNSQLAAAASNTVKGNATSASATPTDLSLPGCSASTAALIWTTNTGFGCDTRVQSFNTRTGAVTPAAGDYTLNQIYNCTIKPQGRLTFSTGVPVMLSTVSGATAHFYTPYDGQQVPIFDGTRFNCTDTGGELTQAATDATKSPAAVANNSCYDVFVWNDGGTIRATRGKVWTNVTTRADALQRINGIYTNGTAVTNGPGLNRGTYVATECSNGTATFDWILGAAASGGTAGNLNVWNQYNRVDVATSVIDNGTSYTYGTNTVRQARASAGNQITFVSGNLEDRATASYSADMQTSTTVTSSCDSGFGLDTTSAFSAQQNRIQTNASAAQRIVMSGSWNIAPQIGRHFVSANENSSGVACTFNALQTDIFSFKFRM